MNKKLLGFFVFLLFISFSTHALASLTFSTNAITGTSASTIDLGSGNTLSLQTTNNAPITIGTGLVTLGGNLAINGNVGIGTTDPLAKLHVNATDTTVGLYSVNASSLVGGGNNVYGLSTSGEYTNSGDFGNVNGSTSFAYVSNNSGPKTITSMTGVFGAASESGDNTIVTNVAGGSFGASVAYGMSGVSFTNFNGVKAALEIGSGDISINNAYGVNIPAFSVGGGITGTLTNLYGLYVGDQSGHGFVNDYNIYSVGSNSKNFFAGSIGIGTTAPNASAALDISSTTKAFMPPRMTTTQRNAISNPVAGMMIYNTTTNHFDVYTTTWDSLVMWSEMPS